ncbi:hypothetical protein A9G41_06970 [Gilliamella sp. Nev5-1]|uniref:hypothetical protein n=1 Tax=Gilliamella sp. Nev3-1 TaxID=3120250 RepID=UPI00080E31FF|nr:hypothetical protein [Gilliamella apicola]OCG57012.1 hypothetical protein A9G40_13615 [Gilliamella apicola]OCG69159.1 hypothetical protein A9G41_06970 [Gilliamella apicola]
MRCQKERGVEYDKSHSEKILILFKFFVVTNSNINPFAARLFYDVQANTLSLLISIWFVPLPKKLILSSISHYLVAEKVNIVTQILSD